MRIYYAHPVNVYDTPLEKAVVILINHCLPEYEVENPNQPHHQAAYAALAARADVRSTEHKGMDDFLKRTVPDCDAIVSQPFLDRKMGLGVAGETKVAVGLKKPAWFIEPPVLDPADTYKAIQEFVANPLCGLFRIREFSADEVKVLTETADLKTNTPSFVVSHEETRLRTFLYYSVKPYRPYELAHLVRMPLPDDFYTYASKK